MAPGVPGIIGVDVPDDGWRPSSERSPDIVLGASNKEPLPSVVSRDSASSSDSTARLPIRSLLLAAYILGAPEGQYMALQYHRVLHSCARMPAKRHKMVIMWKRAISGSIHVNVEIMNGFAMLRDLTMLRGGQGTLSIEPGR